MAMIDAPERNRPGASIEEIHRSEEKRLHGGVAIALVVENLHVRHRKHVRTRMADWI